MLFQDIVWLYKDGNILYTIQVNYTRMADFANIVFLEWEVNIGIYYIPRERQKTSFVKKWNGI